MVKVPNKFTTYDCGGGFAVDVISGRGIYEAWIYHIGYGVKELMTSVPDDKATYDDFINLAESLIEERAGAYANAYLGGGPEKIAEDSEID